MTDETGQAEDKHLCMTVNRHYEAVNVEKRSFWRVTLVPAKRKMQRGKNRGREGERASEWETEREKREVKEKPG